MAMRSTASREHLELLRSSAFESEHAQLYDSSYMQHEAAAQALEQDIENSLVSITPDENSDEHMRIVRTQITIHRERQRALRPHLESGSGVEDEEGRECVFVPAPNHWGANGDLDEESGSLSSVHNLLTWQANYSPLSYTPMYDVLPSPDTPYYDMLDPTQPPITYHLHRTREWTQAGFRKYIYSAREYSDKYALYTLEASHRADSQVTSADFFRVAEFPQPAINILLSGIDSKPRDGSAAYKSRCIHLRGPFSTPIKEYPDRQQKIPWSPRRFTYGGRRFVWKPGDPSDDIMPETLYEYNKDWAKPGSRTGKRLDDARGSRPLVWGEKKKKGKVESYTVHFAGGVDQVFREILLASQMVRQVCLFSSAMDG
ncbi:hypothetical protein B0J11DRAFT_436566 [Dendryphion nanum]|uniref:Uncharacterized protein n=1 Tax=Dendryphion nanum TaxID=256645 RepID=A0A9P9IKF6_9PLEO|nr:hypothetical protein B0J11DRAFT_436566 [Dendryphion nanum]